MAISITYKTAEYELTELKFDNNDEIITFMQWSDLQKRYCAFEQNIYNKLQNKQCIKDDVKALTKFYELMQAEEASKLNDVLKEDDEDDEEEWEKQRLERIETDKAETLKMEEANKKRCDDFNAKFEEKHGVDCETLEPIETVEPITYDDINNKLENGISFTTSKQFTQSSKKSYKNCFKNIHNHFKADDYRQLLNDPQHIINYIYETYDKDSTKKNHTSTLLYIMKSFCPNDENEIKICELNKVLSNNLIAKRSNDNDDNKLPIGKAYALMSFMKEKKDDVFAHLVLNYGVLRPDELYGLKVLDTDNDTDNYINISTKKLIINQHKTLRQYGIKKIKMDDEIINMVKAKLGGHVFTNQKNEPYRTGKGLTDKIIRDYGCSIYDIRKMKTSIVLKDNNEIERERVAKFQGHEVATMVSYYKTHN
jgi:integrase